MKKIKHNETVDDQEGGAAILAIAAAGLGLWAFLRSRREQGPVAPAFALVPRESEAREPVAIFKRAAIGQAWPLPSTDLYSQRTPWAVVF